MDSVTKSGSIDNRGKISVVTATYNALAVLPELIESLRQQVDKDFEWVVADGGSTDGTLELLRPISDINVKVLSSADFGIYDALNKAIKAASGEFYVVAGADDVFFADAISIYRQALVESPDIVAAAIDAGGHIVRPGRGSSWLYGQFAFIAGHSVGSLIRTSLHERYGFYSRKFPIAADQLFIKKCCQAGVKLIQLDSVVGRFGTGGVSSVDVAGGLSEFFRVQLLTEKRAGVQLALYLLRLLKSFPKL